MKCPLLPEGISQISVFPSIPPDENGHLIRSPWKLERRLKRKLIGSLQPLFLADAGYLLKVTTRGNEPPSPSKGTNVEEREEGAPNEEERERKGDQYRTVYTVCSGREELSSSRPGFSGFLLLKAPLPRFGLGFLFSPLLPPLFT